MLVLLYSFMYLYVVQGIVNKLSESNLDPLSAEIVSIYDTNSKALVNSALTESLLTIAGNDTQVRYCDAMQCDVM